MEISINGPEEFSGQMSAYHLLREASTPCSSMDGPKQTRRRGIYYQVTVNHVTPIFRNTGALA
jgi:hypothetical protein